MEKKTRKITKLKLILEGTINRVNLIKEGRNGPADYDLNGAEDRDGRFTENEEVIKPRRRGNKTIMGNEKGR